MFSHINIHQTFADYVFDQYTHLYLHQTFTDYVFDKIKHFNFKKHFIFIISDTFTNWEPHSGVGPDGGSFWTGKSEPSFTMPTKMPKNPEEAHISP